MKQIKQHIISLTLAMLFGSILSLSSQAAHTIQGLSFKQCLSLADSLTIKDAWYNNFIEVNKIKNKCIDKFEGQISLKQCISVADGIRWAGNDYDANKMRYKCLEQFL